MLRLEKRAGWVKHHWGSISKVCIAAVLMPVAFICQADISGHVVRIIDGDTLEVLSENGIQTRVRLNGIDAPEKAQPFGQRSRQALTDLTAGKLIQVTGYNRDRYGRLLGTAWYNSTDINAEQVMKGLAWAYRYQGNAMIPAYERLEETARKNRTGLWSDPAPIEPWRWRKMQKSDN